MTDAADPSTDAPAHDSAPHDRAADDAVRPPLTYEDARDELHSIVLRLESGGSTLEESLQLWQRGEELADICETWLSGAERLLSTLAGDAAKSAPPQ